VIFADSNLNLSLDEMSCILPESAKLQKYRYVNDI